MKHTTIAEQLLRDGYVLTCSMGNSMRPMLTQRTEQLLIEKLTAEPSTNDVVLYRRSSGQYVLHRIVRCRKDLFLIRGDNCYGKPEKVSPQRIIGILKGFYRGKRYISCEKSIAYRVYVVLWRFIYPVRYIVYRCRWLFNSVINKLRR